MGVVWGVGVGGVSNKVNKDGKNKRPHIKPHAQLLTANTRDPPLISKNLLAGSAEAPRDEILYLNRCPPPPQWSPPVFRQALPVKDRKPVQHQPRWPGFVCDAACNLPTLYPTAAASSFKWKCLDNHQPLKQQLVLINSWHRVLLDDPGYQSVAAREASGTVLAWLAEVAKIFTSCA